VTQSVLWASAFAELAKRIERRRIGNPDQRFGGGSSRSGNADSSVLVSSQDED
jgi:hypothetical protein